MYRIFKNTLLVASILYCGSVAQAAPDYVGQLQDHPDPRTGTTTTYTETTWSDSNSVSQPGVGTYTWTQSGSASSGVISDGLLSQINKTLTGPSSEGNLTVLHSATIWAKSQGTHVVTLSTSSGSGSISATPGESINEAQLADSALPGANFDLLGTTGAGSDSLSTSSSGSTSIYASTKSGSGCSSTTTTFAAYPGVTYYKLINLTYDVKARVDIHSLGTSSAGGTISISPAPPTYAAPTAAITGPFVGGVLTPNPAAGSSVSYTSQSYDPDDNVMTPGSGICVYSWTATRDGTSLGSSSSPTFTLTATYPGHYTVQLTVTDNEGVQGTTTGNFIVPAVREKNKSKTSTPEPQAKESDCSGSNKGQGNQDLGGPDGQAYPVGGDDQIMCSADSSSGDVSASAADPITTRGYPLRNDITIHSLRRFSGFTTPMGNAEFTYGMRLITVSSSPTARMVLVDAGGSEYDFGPVTGPFAPEAGVFSTLSTVGSNYQLSGAGAPGNASKAGNYTYSFDSVGELLSITDPSSNVQRLTYTSGILSQVDDLSSGRSIVFGSSAGFITTVSEGGGAAVTNLSYTGGLLTGMQVTDATSAIIRSIAVTYNTDGTLASVVKDGDPSTEFDYTYTDSGAGYNLANLTWPGGGTSYNYFEVPSSGSVARTSRTNAQGQKTYYDYDSLGNLKKIVYPLLNGQSTVTTVTLGYDSSRNLTSWADGTSSYTLTYNALGLPLTITDNASRSWTYAYNGVDPTSVTDAIGTVETLTYGDPSNPHSPTQVTDAASNSWTYTYNAYGQTLSRTPPSGSPTGATSFAYDNTSSDPAYGWLQSITDGSGNTASFGSYSDLGDLLSVTTSPRSGVNETTSYSYDATRRLTQITNPDSTTRTFTFVGKDLTSLTDESGTLSDFTYSSINGDLMSVSLPLSKSLIWNLNSDFEVSSFLDARNNSTSYTYGNGGELKTYTYPDTLATTIQYRRPGEVSVTNQGFAVNYNHDAVGRLSSLVIGSVTLAGYTYRTDDLPSTITDPVGTRTLTYFSNRWLDTVSYSLSGNGLSSAQTVSYTYNADGTVATVTWKSAGTTVASWTYGYDGAGRVNSIANSFGETTSFTYDGEGKLFTQSNANGTSKSITYNDDRGWPTLLEEKRGGTDFASYALTYDSSANTVGNLTGVTEIDSSTMSYGYDALYRLTSEARTGTNPYSTISYDYDLANNLTTVNGSTFATYDTANKFSTITGGSKSYSSIGDLNSASYTGFSISSLSYNYAHQLLTTSTRTNIYYANGVRGGTRLTSPSTSPFTFYVYDGDRIIGEIMPSGATVAYTWGPNGVISERLLGSSASLWYHFGPQGETRQLTNSSGTVVDTYRYNAWGLQLGSTGSDFNPYRYGGRFGYYTDPNIGGVILAGQRWYSPALYRWMTRDPIGYDGGDNTFVYVMGNPVKSVDPEGREALSAAGLFIGGGSESASGAAAAAGAAVAPALVIAGSIGGTLWCLTHQEQCAAFGNKAIECVKKKIDTLSDDGAEQRRIDCEKLYWEIDIPTCKQISRKRGGYAGSRCYESAMRRKNACEKGQFPLPPLDTWNN